MLRSKENLIIALSGVVPAILNYLLLVKVFSLNSITGFDDYVNLYGTYFIVVSIFSQFVPTYRYSKSDIHQGRVLTDYFKIINIFFSFTAFFVFQNPLKPSIIILVFGLTLYNHVMICMTEYFIALNLKKKFVKGAMMGLILFLSKSVTFLIIFYWLQNFYYFFLVEGGLIALFLGRRHFLRKIEIKAPSRDLVVSVVVILGRLIYFILLPWSLYIGAGERVDLKTSIFLNERLFFSGLGLLITPFVPKLMLGRVVGGLNLGFFKITISLILYCCFVSILLNYLDPIIVEKYLNGNLKILLGFVFLMPLHALISFYSRVSLSYNMVQWKNFWCFNVVLVGLGYLQRMMVFDIVYWFLMIVIVQLFLVKSVLNLLPVQKS